MQKAHEVDYKLYGDDMQFVEIGLDKYIPLFKLPSEPEVKLKKASIKETV